MRRPRMPHRITLPFGYVIKVRYQREDAAHGYWDGEARTIIVDSSDHVGEQCETIAHELEHAVTDYRHWVDKTLREPLQMESAETALALAVDEEE